MPVAGETAEQAAKRLADFDKALGDIKGFDKTTGAGQLLRGAGLALAGVGVLASIERAGIDPSLRNDLRVLVDAAGLGQKGAELLAGLAKADSESLLGRLGGSAASKFLGVLTSAMDVWSAADAFGKGDIPSGVLYGVGAGGGLLAAFGSGSLAGPIGIGLVVVSVVGLAVWNGVKEANQHQPDSDGGISMRFLQHAGFSESAARAVRPDRRRCEPGADPRALCPAARAGPWRRRRPPAFCRLDQRDAGRAAGGAVRQPAPHT